jgi:putative Mn2+ efflux pump MntP
VPVDLRRFSFIVSNIGCDILKKVSGERKMHPLLPLITLSFAANVDNVGVGITYGLGNKQIPYAALLLVAVIGGFASGTADWLSSWLRPVLPGFLLGWMAGFTMLIIGLRSYWTARVRITRYVLVLEKEWWFLALGLSFNNLGMGLTGGLLGYEPASFGLVLGGFSGILLWMGCALGARARRIPSGPWVHYVSGSALILLGLYQIITS